MKIEVFCITKCEIGNAYLRVCFKFANLNYYLQLYATKSFLVG